MNETTGAQTGSHSALMDDVYRHQRFIYDLTRKYYLFGRDKLIRELDLRPGEQVIEIGCGTARNLIRMAKRYPDAQFYGLDASQEMLKTAAQQIARAGLTGRIHLAHGYAEALSPALFGRSEGFGRAIFSYSLSMIPDWRRSIISAQQCLKDDGRLHIVDFGDLTGLGRWGQAAMRAWLRLFHVEPRIAILHLLESTADPMPGSRRRLTLLPGRYAFLFSCGKAEVPVS